MKLYICPKVLSCRRLSSSVLTGMCAHGKPHEKRDECHNAECTKVEELEHYKCACVPMKSLRDANQLKIRLKDL